MSRPPDSNASGHRHEAIRGPHVRSSSAGRALAAIVLAGVSAMLMIIITTRFLASYGLVVFVVLPVWTGYFAALVYNWNAIRGMRRSLLVAFGAAALGGIGLLALSIEGLACLVMALPLCAPLVLLGGALGAIMAVQCRRKRRGFPVMMLVLCAAPLLAGAEAGLDRAPPVFAVTTSIDVNAPPEEVWLHVIAFPEIPAPVDLLFRGGIAYPIRAEVRGRGPGAIRHCVFSTGAFVEPIETWDEPRLLRFTVTENPPSMTEWTPFGEAHPPHVRGYLLSHRGQFRLHRLPGGRTRLEGTTWYEHGLWPAWYWRLWSDHIIHRIHLRVLDHIRMQVEAERRG